MRTIARRNGVELRVPEDFDVKDLETAPPPPRRRTPLVSERIVLPEEATPGGAAAALVEALRGQDLAVLDSFEISAGLPGPKRRAAADCSAELVVEIPAAEDVVVLLEQDEVFSWRFPEPGGAAPVELARRGPLVAPPRKRVSFTLAPGEPSARRPRARGVISDFVVGRVRAYVLKFVARVAVRELMRFLERHVRRGMVVLDPADPSGWRKVDDLRSCELPGGRPARLLLLVHGTFSSTVGSFGALAASDWGRAFLERAARRYDLVLGYDHPTLSEDPLANAADLLASLERLPSKTPPVLDAIAFSRGALVLRSLVERLLPGSSLRARVRRAVFVAGTNGGTRLAEPANWERFVDLYTNLAAAACRMIQFMAPAAAVAGQVLKESLQSLGALVKYVAVTTVDERAVPGLAAMEPSGRFVEDLNRPQPGQPAVGDSYYCVITSNFEPDLTGASAGQFGLPARLAQWIADGVADGVMSGSNDLVVDTASMSRIAPQAGSFVKDRLEFSANPYVYHTNYFTRPEVVGALTRWLEVEDRARTAAGVTAYVPGFVSDNILVASAAEPATSMLESIKRSSPSHIVLTGLEVDPSLCYAFDASEFLDAWQRLPRVRTRLNVAEAFRKTGYAFLPEEASKSWQLDQPLDLRPAVRSSPASRLIVFEGDLPRGVVEPSLGTFTGEEIAVAPRPTGRRGVAAVITPAPKAAPLPKPARPRRAATATVAAPAPPTRERLYFGASMPPVIPLGQVAAVHVGVSKDACEALAETLKTADVDLTGRLIVQLVPKVNLEVQGDDRADLDPRDVVDRVDLLFEVKGTHAGEAEAWVVFRQGPVALATIVLKPRVDGAVSAAGAERPLLEVANAYSEPSTDARYPVLQIFEVSRGTAQSYHFVLDTADGSYLSSESDPLKGDRAAYVTELYEEIENCWVGSDRSTAAFQLKLQAFGGQLFDTLIPLDIQDALWKARDQLRAIHVLSEEPFIPWELVHLKPPRQAGAPPQPVPAGLHFLAQKGLVRWLHNRGRACRDIRIRSGRASYVIPDYPEPGLKLPAAQEEIPFVRDRLKASPLAADPFEIIQCLRGPGALDLFHFSGHGEAESDPTRARFARILLRGEKVGGAWQRRYLTSQEVQQHAQLVGSDGSRPLVVLNACQIGRGSWQLTSLGGFAEACLRAGAGAFVGALWSVGDAPAKSFTEGFYEALLAGKVLAEAAACGREAARKAGDATWLAYVVYGHPWARVSLA
jgi:hypothetical protein